MKKIYKLPDGSEINTSHFTPIEKKFLKEIEQMIKKEAFYFDVYAFALGPRSVAIQGRQTVTREISETSLYLVTQDMVIQYGVKQGLIISDEQYEDLKRHVPESENWVLIGEAARKLNITFSKTKILIKNEELITKKFGSFQIQLVNVDSIEEYLKRERNN